MFCFSFYSDIDNLGIASSSINASVTLYQCLVDSSAPVSFVWSINSALSETNSSTIVLKDSTQKIDLICEVHNRNGKKISHLTIPVRGMFIHVYTVSKTLCGTL